MLIDDIKENEGFRGNVYKDTLGFDTIGYGIKLPITKKEAITLLKHRLNKKKAKLIKARPHIAILPEEIQNVLFEMAYQLGVGGILKFKKMFEALEEEDHLEASYEMLDSKWAKQTPNRAKKLAEKVRDYGLS